MMKRASEMPATQAVMLLENQKLMSEGQAEMCICSPHLVWVHDDRRHKLTPTMKAKIYDRDGRICAYCDDAGGPFNIDHIYPLSRGGDNSPSNLCVACASCNAAKRDMTVHEWLGELDGTS